MKLDIVIIVLILLLLFLLLPYNGDLVVQKFTFSS